MGRFYSLVLVLWLWCLPIHGRSFKAQGLAKTPLMTGTINFLTPNWWCVGALTTTPLPFLKVGLSCSLLPDGCPTSFYVCGVYDMTSSAPIGPRAPSIVDANVAWVNVWPGTSGTDCVPPPINPHPFFFAPAAGEPWVTPPTLLCPSNILVTGGSASVYFDATSSTSFFYLGNGTSSFTRTGADDGTCVDCGHP